MAEAHIHLYSEIGYWGTRADDVRYRLNNQSFDTIVVHINSPGGDVFEGFAIYNLLIGYAKSGKKVRMLNEGLCASIASIIAMAGTEREGFEASMFMVHNPWTYASGNADELEKTVALLRKLEDMMVNIYAKGTGLAENKIRKMMDEETYLTPAEAKTNGFLTKVTESDSAMPIALIPEGFKAVAKLDPSKFKDFTFEDNSQTQVPNQVQDTPMALSNEDKSWFASTIEKLFGAKAQAETAVEAPKVEETTTTQATTVTETVAETTTETAKTDDKDAQIAAKEAELAALKAEKEQLEAEKKEAETAQASLAKQVEETNKMLKQLMGEGKEASAKTQVKAEDKPLTVAERAALRAK